MNNRENHHARSLADIAVEMKQEIVDFAETRIEMLKSELRDNLSHWKIAAPLTAVTILLFGTAYLLFTGALVVLVAVLIGSTPYTWVLALLIVGALCSMGGILGLWLAKREVHAAHLVPQKTVELLKEDKAWLQQEARMQA